MGSQALDRWFCHCRIVHLSYPHLSVSCSSYVPLSIRCANIEANLSQFPYKRLQTTFRIGTNGQSGQLLKLNAPHLSPRYHAVRAIMLIKTLHRAHRAPINPIWCVSSYGSRVLRWPPQRHFASSQRTAIAVAEMRKEDLASLRINQGRLMEDIHSTCEWGKGERWGE